jgi:hypothetical protein
MAKVNELKLGDIVRLSKTSQYYFDEPKDSSSNNPINMSGQIISVDEENYGYPLEVRWDNTKTNVYDWCDLDLVGSARSRSTKSKPSKRNRSGAYTVDEEFIKQAHEAACSDWKSRIEGKFPELFPNNKYVCALFDSKNVDKAANADLYVKLEDGSYVKTKIQLIHGLAGSHGIDKQAKGCGIYIPSGCDISPRIVNYGEYTDCAILFEPKVSK